MASSCSATAVQARPRSTSVRTTASSASSSTTPPTAAATSSRHSRRPAPGSSWSAATPISTSAPAARSCSTSPEAGRGPHQDLAEEGARVRLRIRRSRGERAGRVPAPRSSRNARAAGKAGPYPRPGNFRRASVTSAPCARSTIDAFEGGVLAIVGDNGAGKSTLIKILAACISRIAARSGSTAGLATRMRRATVNRTSLTAEVGQLSGGQRQSIALGRATAEHGRVIIMTSRPRHSASGNSRKGPGSEPAPQGDRHRHGQPQHAPRVLGRRSPPGAAQWPPGCGAPG